MLCGSKYVQNKATKEIMITQTESAAKIVKLPMSAARVSVGWLVRLVLMSHVKCLNRNKLFHSQPRAKHDIVVAC